VPERGGGRRPARRRPGGRGRRHKRHRGGALPRRGAGGLLAAHQRRSPPTRRRCCSTTCWAAAGPRARPGGAPGRWRGAVLGRPSLTPAGARRWRASRAPAAGGERGAGQGAAPHPLPRPDGGGGGSDRERAGRPGPVGTPAIVVDLGRPRPSTASPRRRLSRRGDRAGRGHVAEELSGGRRAWPRVELRRPQRAAGAHHRGVAALGVLWGAAGQVDALVGGWPRDQGHARVIATGGWAKIVAPEWRDGAGGGRGAHAQGHEDPVEGARVEVPRALGLAVPLLLVAATAWPQAVGSGAAWSARSSRRRPPRAKAAPRGA